ncbi:MAG: hypothetical protein ACFFG0_48530 [Candidatus Thorarchaeota archaeon]
MSIVSIIRKIQKIGPKKEEEIDKFLKEKGYSFTLKELRTKGYIEIKKERYKLTDKGKEELKRLIAEQHRKNIENLKKKNDELKKKMDTPNNPHKHILKITIENGFIHIRYRNPSQFGIKGKRIFRTPSWTKPIVNSVLPKGKEGRVRMGKLPSGKWKVQAILIDKSLSLDQAEKYANMIIEKIEK